MKDNVYLRRGLYLAWLLKALVFISIAVGMLGAGFNMYFSGMDIKIYIAAVYLVYAFGCIGIVLTKVRRLKASMFLARIYFFLWSLFISLYAIDVFSTSSKPYAIGFKYLSIFFALWLLSFITYINFKYSKDRSPNENLGSEQN